MSDNLTKLHRVLLWLSLVVSLIFGVGYFLAPVQFQAFFGAPTPDPAAIRSIGGFLLGAAIGAWLCLRSNSWSEVRITTTYLAAWNLLNGLGLLFGLASGGAGVELLPNLILLLVIGVGLSYVIWQRRAVLR